MSARYAIIDYRGTLLQGTLGMLVLPKSSDMIFWSSMEKKI